MLCHLEKTRTEETIRQHFTWQGLRLEVQLQYKSYHVCQVTQK